MVNLKRSLFWVSLYLIIMFVIAAADYLDRPIINFASYFYLSVLVAIPVTLFFPGIARAPVYLPLAVWAGIYLVVLQMVDRGASTETIDYAVIVLEFILLQLGVWLVYQLAIQVSYAESLMDALAQGAYPSRARDIDQEYQHIKVEFARCRRYNRPVSLIVVDPAAEEGKTKIETFKTLQHELSHRFQSARVGQLLDDHIRQIDLILKEPKGRFVILCPETELTTASLLARRIAQVVNEKTDLQIRWGAAAFPGDALTFDDLLQKAHAELANFVSVHPEAAAPAENQLS